MTLFSFYLHSDPSIQIWFMTFFLTVMFPWPILTHPPYRFIRLDTFPSPKILQWNPGRENSSGAMEGRAQVTSAMDPVACSGGTQHLSPGSPGHRQGESSPIKWDHCMVHSAHAQTGAKEGRFRGQKKCFLWQSLCIPDSFQKASIIKERFIMGNQAGQMGCSPLGLCGCWVASVVSDSVQLHRRQPTRLPRPWDSPGKNTGVGCHFLLQCMKVKSESEVTESCPTLSDPMDCSPPWDFPGKSTEVGCHCLLHPWDFIITIYCPNCPSRATLSSCQATSRCIWPRMRKWQDQALFSTRYESRIS